APLRRDLSPPAVDDLRLKVLPAIVAIAIVGARHCPGCSGRRDVPGRGGRWRTTQRRSAMAKRADAISVTSLSKSIDRAVAMAVKRQDLKPMANNLSVHGQLMGRILRDFDDANAAFSFATEVTRNVSVPGVRMEPAVFKLGPDILAGFIERVAVPQRF